VTVAEPEDDGFAVETALTVTVVVVLPPDPLEVVGTPLGATYSPELEIKPLLLLPPVVPLTCHVTAVLVIPFTAAVHCWVVKMATEMGFGVTLTETCCAIVTIANEETEEFADETAATETVAGLGMELGAVYSPAALIVPTVELPPAVPLTCHVTVVFVVPVTRAVNCFICPGLTVAEAGVTAMVIGVVVVLPPPQEAKNGRMVRLGIRKNVRRMTILIQEPGFLR
jgi:hypothetical protein